MCTLHNCLNNPRRDSLLHSVCIKDFPMEKSNVPLTTTTIYSDDLQVESDSKQEQLTPPPFSSKFSLNSGKTFILLVSFPNLQAEFSLKLFSCLLALRRWINKTSRSISQIKLRIGGEGRKRRLRWKILSFSSGLIHLEPQELRLKIRGEASPVANSATLIKAGCTRKLCLLVFSPPPQLFRAKTKKFFHKIKIFLRSAN